MQWQWQLADASIARRKALVAAVAALGRARAEAPKRVSRTLLDTFDERLAATGLVLEATGRKQASWALTLRGANLTHGEHWQGDSLPRSAADIPRPRIASRVGRVLGSRVLLAICNAQGTSSRLAWFDALDKRIAEVEIFHAAPGRHADALLFVDVRPVRGFEQAAARLLRSLRRGPLAQATAIDPALALRMVRGGPAYRAKPVLALQGKTPAAAALAALLDAYGQVLWANEPGILADLDPEFLHDYRVALRSLRSWVGDLRKVLGKSARTRVKAELATLNRVTGHVRDLDVLQAELPGYLAALGGVDAAQAARLDALVGQARDEARHALIAHLRGGAYRKFHQRWRSLCQRLADGSARGRDGALPLREVVAAAIARRLDDILAFDWAAAEREPALLHALRKECKKLRYLLEGFQRLFEPALCRRAIAELKTVQTAMGDTWDLHVHHALLEGLGKHLAPDDARAVLPVVVGLGTRLSALEQAHVEIVARAFERFRAPSVQRIYRRLLERP